MSVSRSDIVKPQSRPRKSHFHGSVVVSGQTGTRTIPRRKLATEAYHRWNPSLKLREVLANMMAAMYSAQPRQSGPDASVADPRRPTKTSSPHLISCCAGGTLDPLQEQRHLPAAWLASIQRQV